MCPQSAPDVLRRGFTLGPGNCMPGHTGALRKRIGACRWQPRCRHACSHDGLKSLLYLCAHTCRHVRWPAGAKNASPVCAREPSPGGNAAGISAVLGRCGRDRAQSRCGCGHSAVSAVGKARWIAHRTRGLFRRNSSMNCWSAMRACVPKGVCIRVLRSSTRYLARGPTHNKDAARGTR